MLVKKMSNSLIDWVTDQSVSASGRTSTIHQQSINFCQKSATWNYWPIDWLIDLELHQMMQIVVYEELFSKTR